MLKQNTLALVFAGLLVAFSIPGSAKEPDKKAIERVHVHQQTKAFLEAYEDTTDLASLSSMHENIESVWSRYTKLFGTDTSTASRLAKLRSRANVPTSRRSEVASNWRHVIKDLPTKTSQLTRLTYFTRAASASAEAEDYYAAREFFAAARTLATARGDGQSRARLYLRIEELKSTGEGMEWRRLNHALLDLRKYSSNFVMWTVPRLDALIGESEIRVAMQPNSEEKRNTLGQLKADIVLLQKSMEGAIPPGQTDRIRSLFYALEDHFDL